MRESRMHLYFTIRCCSFFAFFITHHQTCPLRETKALPRRTRRRKRRPRRSPRRCPPLHAPRPTHPQPIHLPRLYRTLRTRPILRFQVSTIPTILLALQAPLPMHQLPLHVQQLSPILTLLHTLQALLPTHLLPLCVAQSLERFTSLQFSWLLLMPVKIGLQHFKLIRRQWNIQSYASGG